MNIMSRARRALSLARQIGKEQAQEWLYDDTSASIPQTEFELAAWRAACYADVVRKYEHDNDVRHLLNAWETAFDKVIDNSKDAAGLSIIRAVITEDIWTGGGLERAPVFLARKGDIVNIQPSPFAEWPVTIIPRNGLVFCATHSQVSDIKVIAVFEPVGGAA